jgi:hypothetical protein
MTNEEKAKLLEKESRTIDRFGSSLTPPDNFAALLREAAQLMRERDKRSLLVERDWKTMYEAQERDLAALEEGAGVAMSLLGKLIDEARGEK